MDRATLLDEHAKACEHVLNQWKGTPEEFGALLHDATMSTHFGSWAFRKEQLERKAAARQTIHALDGGTELLRLDYELHQRSL